MFIDRNSTVGQGRAGWRGLDLKDLLGELDGVVLIDHALVLYREDAVEILMVEWHKSRAALRRRHFELSVEFLDVNGRQKLVRFLDGRDSTQPQLLR